MERKGGTTRGKKAGKHFLIDGVFFKTFTVLFLGTLSTVLTNIIDAVVTGQFLGSSAVAAMGLVAPMIALSGVITGFFVTGTNQLCTRNMGKADIHKVNQVFSTMVVSSLSVCMLTCALMFFLSPLYVAAVAKGTDAQTASMALDYLRGFSFAVPGIGLAVLLCVLMPLDNDRTRGLGFALIMLFLDLVLDLVNVFVLHGGVLGMAVASVVSCYAGLIWLFLHFKKPGHLLRFLPGDLCFSDVREALSYGVSGALLMLMNSVRGFCINAVLIREGGTWAVAGYSAASGVLFVIVALASTVQSTTASLAGLSYGEQDASGLRRTLTNALSFSYRVYLVLGTVLFIGAGAFARIFLNDASAADAVELAAVFIRCLAIQNAFSIFSYAITGIYMGTDRLKLNYLIAVLRDGLFPCLSVFLLGTWFGIPGVGAGFVAAGLLTFITILVISAVISGKAPMRIDDLLVLPESFALSPSEYFEASIDSVEDVVPVSERAYAFCIEKGEDRKTAQLVSLFIEEMCGNAVRHGIGGVRNGMAEVRLIRSEEGKVIRIKDNGRPFDPVLWLEENHPEDPAANIGIRMVVGLCKEVKYVPAMSINNLLLYI